MISAWNRNAHDFRIRQFTDKKTVKICIKCFCILVLTVRNELSLQNSPYNTPVYITKAEFMTEKEPNCEDLEGSPLKALAYEYLRRKIVGLEDNKKK